MTSSKRKTPSNTPAWLVNPVVEKENELRLQQHFQHHVLPRFNRGSKYLDFDGKCDYETFQVTRALLEAKWDREEAEARAF